MQIVINLTAVEDKISNISYAYTCISSCPKYCEKKSACEQSVRVYYNARSPDIKTHPSATVFEASACLLSIDPYPYCPAITHLWAEAVTRAHGLNGVKLRVVVSNILHRAGGGGMLVKPCVFIT